ncbi:MAG: thioredoxin fold domain-containing protein [Burkholderiales bacterium]|nr:thioredoxin fold domain-containing protein [Burkholderiales bacterium]
MKRLKYRVGFFAAILACLALTSAHAVERGILPLATDLSKDAKLARDKRIPILILFSMTGCVYCDRVRDEVLIPTTRNAEYDNKVIMVEVDYSNLSKMIDFNGKTTTQAAFAAKNRIGLTPTVKFFDSQGREVADPIVGLVTVDYYGGFLDQAIDASIAKIRRDQPVLSF